MSDGGCACSCGSGAVNLLYACSGAANTGLLADRTARGLVSEGAGKMTCLAALGAGLSGFIESAKAADRNIVIDGCPVACGEKVFEKLGLPFDHFMTTDFGVEKGKTAITEEVVKRTTEKIKEAVCAR
ncbi:MAG: putative zinc-binding protein [Spirochaetales bacterium]|nr:putative zinc-binding protein [Spirochaetales bacterium]